jgi:Family of unknown function (DUF7019)
MFRKLFRRRARTTPRYYLYLSKIKVELLYSQIPHRLRGSLDAEVKASVGVLQATVRGSTSPVDPDLYANAEAVTRYLTKYGKIGSLAEPASYIRDTVSVRFGVVSEYAADIAFFGGRIGEVRLALIGSSDSMIGNPSRAESRHAPFYYTLKFLSGIAEREVLEPATRPPYFGYSEAYEIALNATTSPETHVEFLGRLLHRESDLFVVTPIYVSLAD